MGGAGYIGSHTVKHLLDHGYHVTVADNLVYGHRRAVDKRADFYHADLLDEYSLSSLFSSNKFDAVVHFAAFAYVGESVKNPSKYYINNVIGSINLLNCMLKHGVNKIVFSSTCATYGEPVKLPISEDHSQKPINPYGRSKLMIEQIFLDFEKAYGLQHITLRYFNAAGASISGEIGESHNPETHLIPLVLKAIRGEMPFIKVFGNDYKTKDGTCVRDYIHVEDLALAHRLALEKLGNYSGCINLGAGIGSTVMDVIHSAESITKKKCPIEIVHRRAGDPAMLYADNHMAKEILGWAPKFSDLNTIISTAWNWECNKKF